MSHFTDALKTASTIAVDSIDLGDSITEGMLSPHRENAWPQRFRDLVRTHCGLTGGLGYAPSYSVSSHVGDFWAPSGPVDVGILSTGLGCRMYKVWSGGQITMGFTGTGLDVLYTACPDACFTYQVDGGSEQTVDRRGSALSSGNVVKIRSLSDGAHTIVVKGSSIGSAYLEGAHIYRNDETNGFRVWEAGHSGWMASDFNATSNWHGSFLAVPNTKLVIITLGRNEYQKAVSSASFHASLDELTSTVVSLIAGKTASGVIQAEHKRMPISGYPDWADYEAAMQDVASNHHFGFVKQSDNIGDPAAAIAAGLIESGTGCHPTTTGHQIYANGLFDTLGVASI